MSVRDLLGKARLITISEGGPPVERTVAELLVQTVAPEATVRAAPPASAGPAHIAIDGRGEKLTGGAEEWMSFAIGPGGSARLSTSGPEWLYALSSLLVDEWLDCDEREFAQERRIVPAFPWLRNLSDFFVGSARHARHFERESYVRQLARMGFSHVTINALGVKRPFESGPPGDQYHWFYDYSPDLDQFIESALLKGYYPPEYLQANLNALKQNAELTRKYGLVPGLHINSPRSMPEEFWALHGYLRGARVDHPRETFRPRYTLAMAHPVVQEHYRELLRQIMREIPEIGFIHVWTNDSGSGFEFVTSLYAGRNGGPYLIREWKSEDEIARAAARNVMTYYRLLRDEGRSVNPEFRLVCDLGPFYVERKYLIPGLGAGIDAGEFAYFESQASPDELDGLKKVEADIHVKLDLSDNNILGLPYPRLTYERLAQVRRQGSKRILTGSTPHSLAPFDINAEVVRHFQLLPHVPFEEVVFKIASRWVGAELAPALLEIWELSDEAVRGYPPGVPMSTFAFPWFRLWVRPFVPNIDAIPEEERAYYEDFLLATFNNPARVDLNNDMMWNFLSVNEAAGKKADIDTLVLAVLAEAIERCRSARDHLSAGSAALALFADLHDRLVAGRCFYRTMRNTMAWTESVHGYLKASAPGQKKLYRALCSEMVENELENTRLFLRLWTESRSDFMPVSSVGETIHMYAENLGNLLLRKIQLMEKYGKEEPYIDPGYMWRIPRR
jgi:hypothetical protein